VRKSILLVLSVALAVMVFAPVAAAQSDDMGQDDKGMHARGADDRGMDDRGMDDRGMDDRGFDDRGMDDNATASPASSASAMGSASATSSATGTATSSATSSASSATAAPSNELPDTGGISLIPVLSAAVLALLIGSGVVATVLARRAS
jgi:hypothetical protein